MLIIKEEARERPNYVVVKNLQSIRMVALYEYQIFAW